MNILPRTWFAGRKSNEIGSSAVARAGMALGPWSDQINGFVPRQANPWFYEALRESLGILDGAINRLVTVDGIIGIEGGNDKLVQMIQKDLVETIPVGDLQGGLHAFYAGQGNELYEQGFTVGEMVFDRRGRELIGLRVADSKGVVFHRNVDTGRLETWYLPPVPNAAGRKDGTDAIETVLRNGGRQFNAELVQGKGYTQIDPARMVYAAFNPENDQPYGASLLRSIEFVGQILLKMHNATGLAWDRFGDPVFHVNYKTKNRALKDDALEKRRKALATSLQSALNIKRSGNSADFVTAVGSDDEVTVTVIGHDGHVLEIEMPARHMLEQVQAKTGLPGWMLGLQFSTAERMADNQAEVVLQESKTRFEARKHGMKAVVEAWLRGRGLTWKPGDWQVVQQLPNLRDELKRAQAGFLNAQTAMMQANGGRNPAAPAGVDPQSDPGNKGFGALDDLDPVVRNALRQLVSKQAPHVHKASGGEQWASKNPALPRIANAGIALMQAKWSQLGEDTLKALGLPTTKAAGEVFAWDAASMLQRLLNLQSEFILMNSKGDSELAKLVFQIWSEGLTQQLAAAESAAPPAEAMIEAARSRYSAAVPTELEKVLSKTVVREYQEGIVKAIQEGAYNGTKPTEVARQLRKQFGHNDYDWERLVFSEMVASHAMGELEALTLSNITQYNFLLSPDACSICVGIHAKGPYTVGSGPLPVRDTHPLCACTIEAYYPPSE